MDSVLNWLGGRLARYLFPTPPVPQRFRRKLLALGSGDPTRAIFSTLIA